MDKKDSLVTLELEKDWSMRLQDMDAFGSAFDSPCAVLRPALPDLEARCEEAFFWRKHWLQDRYLGIKGFRHGGSVRTVPLSKAVHGLRGVSSITDHMSRMTEAMCCDHVIPLLPQGMWRTIWDFSNAWLKPFFESSLREPADPSARLSEEDANIRELRDGLHLVFNETLYDFARLRFHQDLALEFLPLFGLWVAGNFPYGIDRNGDGDYVVLVSD